MQTHRRRGTPTARSPWRRPPNWAAAPAASPGGGCQFLGTAATAQVVGEALGLSLPHSALAPSGQPIWLDMAARSARALMNLRNAADHHRADRHGRIARTTRWSVHAAFGGSTNLLLHIPAIAHAAGLPRPTVKDWIAVNRKIPRLVDALAQRPGRASDGARLPGRRRAGGDAASPRAWGCFDETCLTVTGEPLGQDARWWETSERRGAGCARYCCANDGVDPDDVIMSPAPRRDRGLTSTVTFPRGNLAPHGLGHQEHRNRSQRGGCRRRLSHDGPGASLHHRAGGDRRHQERRRSTRAM